MSQQPEPITYEFWIWGPLITLGRVLMLIYFIEIFTRLWWAQAPERYFSSRVYCLSVQVYQACERKGLALFNFIETCWKLTRRILQRVEFLFRIGVDSFLIFRSYSILCFSWMGFVVGFLKGCCPLWMFHWLRSWNAYWIVSRYVTMPEQGDRVNKTKQQWEDLNQERAAEIKRRNIQPPPDWDED